MPDEPIRYLKEGGQGEIVEKRSRFLATLSPVTSEEEALLFIEQMKKRYWDARHNCYAYVLGDRAELCRCSDDGEPPHTAGRPMLDALLASGIRNAVVVVTRYFGGILLGTGGLTRAYREAVLEGIRNCKTLEKTEVAHLFEDFHPFIGAVTRMVHTKSVAEIFLQTVDDLCSKSNLG